MYKERVIIMEKWCTWFCTTCISNTVVSYLAKKIVQQKLETPRQLQIDFHFYFIGDLTETCYKCSTSPTCTSRTHHPGCLLPQSRPRNQIFTITPSRAMLVLSTLFTLSTSDFIAEETYLKFETRCNQNTFLFCTAWHQIKKQNKKDKNKEKPTLTIWQVK